MLNVNLTLRRETKEIKEIELDLLDLLDFLDFFDRSIARSAMQGACTGACERRGR